MGVKNEGRRGEKETERKRGKMETGEGQREEEHLFYHIHTWLNSCTTSVKPVKKQSGSHAMLES